MWILPQVPTFTQKCSLFSLPSLSQAAIQSTRATPLLPLKLALHLPHLQSKEAVTAMFSDLTRDGIRPDIKSYTTVMRVCFPSLEAPCALFSLSLLCATTVSSALGHRLCCSLPPNGTT